MTQQEPRTEAWTLFDQKRQRVYGGHFGSKHEAWQGRDNAALPPHIVPRRKAGKAKGS